MQSDQAFQLSSRDYLLRLADQLKHNSYSHYAVRKRMAAASQFALYVERSGMRLEMATQDTEQAFLDVRLRRSCRRYGHRPKNLSHWRSDWAPGIHMLMTIVTGQWPPAAVPGTAREAFHSELCNAYAKWMSTVRGLVSITVHNQCVEAKRFLEWLGAKGDPKILAALEVSDLDQYISFRSQQVRRATCQRVVMALRGFTRFLYRENIISANLSSALTSSRRYSLENIPSALREDDIGVLLKTTRTDVTPKGLRDYAILLLLSRYGMRAGEITSLKLEAIDWRNNRLCIRHSKTQSESFVPLLEEVGEAIIAYLKKGRPTIEERTLFIRMRAPFRPLHSGTSLYHMVAKRIHSAGVASDRKCGTRAIRHARAVSLLERGCNVKLIGDILGHKSLESTEVYLKLATSELRGVALTIPREAML
jgi:integrase/recombinase XerD